MNKKGKFYRLENFAKSILKKAAFQIFDRTGWYPLKRFQSPETIYYKLTGEPVRQQERQLKKITQTYRRTNNQEYYEALLGRYVRQWEPATADRAEFTAQGKGKTTLNTYRKVRIDNVDYFEKIYFNSYPDLQILKWLQTEVYDKNTVDIRIPRIEKIYSGEFLSIVYFEFLSLSPIPQTKLVQTLIDKTKELYEFSYTNRKITVSPQKIIKDYTRHPKYEKSSQLAFLKLKKYGFNPVNLEKLADKSPQVLTHGNISRTNVFENSIVIDWDYAGFFPVGFDVAALCWHLLKKMGLSGNIINWLQDNYKNKIRQKDWNDFERNFYFILFVLAQELRGHPKYGKWEVQLVEALNLNKEGAGGIEKNEKK